MTKILVQFDQTLDDGTPFSPAEISQGEDGKWYHTTMTGTLWHLIPAHEPMGPFDTVGEALEGVLSSLNG